MVVAANPSGIEALSPGLPGCFFGSGKLRISERAKQLEDAFFSLAGGGVYYGETAGGSGCIAGVILNCDGIPGNVALMRWDGKTEVRGPNFDMGTFPPPYRLEFSVVGNDLRLRVLNLSSGELIRERTLSSTNRAEGWVGLWVNRRNDPGNTFTITADNYILIGAKP